MTTSKKTLRAGIVGSRFAASFHHHAIQRVHGVDVQLAGVFSPSKDSREAFAKARGLRPFESLEALLAEVDVLHVCSNAFSHEAVGIAALEAGVHPIIEKPFTGAFGDGSPGFDGRAWPKERALEQALASVERLLAAERKSTARILYAENWVYAPAVQKEREILEKTGGQILWMHGEESHSGSHSKAYGEWRLSGGGSLMGKGCHPLTAALYLKRVEGRARDGKPIRPAAVSARVHEVTRLKGFRDEGHLRTDYNDVEDFGFMHVVFEDGTVADIYSTELVMGGVHNWLEVCANNHRSLCNINPNTAMQSYNPREEAFRDIYVVEKIGTKQGWACISPDEDWFTGYYQEAQAFYTDVAQRTAPESDSGLGADTISTIYSAYVSAERRGAEVAIKAC